MHEKLEVVKKMKKHFKGLKTGQLPKRYLDLNFEKDILPVEGALISKYGFLKEEIDFIMRKKPSFLV